MLRITSKDNPHIISAGGLRQKKHRDETGLFIISGKKLAKEALLSRIKIKEAFFTDGFALREADFVNSLVSAYTGASFYTFDERLCGKLTDEEAPEGIFCVCEKPEATELPRDGFVLICERLSDPGNVGTVIRSARAFGAGVILTPDCADPYSPKVLRAAMGAVFSRRVSFCSDVKSAVSGLKENGYTVYAAALHKKAAPLSKTDLSKKSAVIIGNEGAGLTDAAIDACDGVILIEMEKECESLNAAVAASVIMYRAYKGD
ncbi:MAG: RNA methyltransferase [Clostridia bacterium]|nr:RNA methyltransferase [Clostridia bacterium]